MPNGARNSAVGVFTNLGGGQALRNAVARIALRIAARYSPDEKVD